MCAYFQEEISVTSVLSGVSMELNVVVNTIIYMYTLQRVVKWENYKMSLMNTIHTSASWAARRVSRVTWARKAAGIIGTDLTAATIAVQTFIDVCKTNHTEHSAKAFEIVVPRDERTQILQNAKSSNVWVNNFRVGLPQSTISVVD